MGEEKQEGMFDGVPDRHGKFKNFKNKNWCKKLGGKRRSRCIFSKKKKSQAVHDPSYLIRESRCDEDGGVKLAS